MEIEFFDRLLDFRDFVFRAAVAARKAGRSGLVGQIRAAAGAGEG